jgi:hypothetical protein
MNGDPCVCLEAACPAARFERSSLGTDDRYGEISRWICAACRRPWLHYLLEFEGIPGSGRWFRLPGSLERLVELPGYFAGGGHFGGQAGWIRGPLSLRESPSEGPLWSVGGVPMSGGVPPALPADLQAFVRGEDDGDPHFPPHVARTVDGRRVAFSTRRVKEGVTRVWVGTKALTEIPGSAVHPCLFWSPDGRHLGMLVVHLEEERSALIVFRDLQGGGEILHRHELLDGVEAPAWSPSGKSIAFLRTRNPRHEFTRAGDPELVLLDAETGAWHSVSKAGEATGPLIWAGERSLRAGKCWTFSRPV